MYQYRTISPAELSDDEARTWSELCLATPEFQSPLLGPDFARLVGRWRPDAEIAVVTRRDNGPVGFFAFHRRPGGVARPIGAPFSDVQAVVSHDGALFTGAGLMRALGLGRFKHQALSDPHGLFPGQGDAVASRFTIDLSRGSAITLDRTELEAWARNAAALAAKQGALSIDVADADIGALETVFRWRSRKLVRDGLQDVLKPRWVRGLMRDAFALQGDNFRGRLVTLRAGGKLVAGLFGVEANGVFHPWVSSHDPAFGAHAPEDLLMLKAIESLPAAGVDAIALGDDAANVRRWVHARQTLVRAGDFEATDQVRRTGPNTAPARGALARLGRRLDQIAMLEPSWPMRAAGVIAAMANAPRRVAGG